MSKIHFPLNKETYIGLGLFIGLFLLFLVNVSLIVISLVEAYGHQKAELKTREIDATVLSEAVKILEGK